VRGVKVYSIPIAEEGKNANLLRLLSGGGHSSTRCKGMASSSDRDKPVVSPRGKKTKKKKTWGGPSPRFQRGEVT